jgi:hypothetical protein
VARVYAGHQQVPIFVTSVLLADLIWHGLQILIKILFRMNLHHMTLKQMKELSNYPNVDIAIEQEKN